MNTRKSLRRSPLTGKPLCAYCGQTADTRDHTPPRCLLKQPLPSSTNLITLPACKKCNSGFSFAEGVVKTFIVRISRQPDLVAERQRGGSSSPTLEHPSIRRIIEEQRTQDGKYQISGELLDCFRRVLFKTVQGLFFAMYQRIVATDQLQVLSIEERSIITPDEVVDRVRPSPLRDITDEPLPDLTPSSWPMREPIFIIELPASIYGKEAQKRSQRIFRLVRETEVEWIPYQQGVFTFGFVKAEDGRAVCIMDLWETLVVAVAAPWPDDRGPLRRGRRNPFSRERRVMARN